MADTAKAKKKSSRTTAKRPPRQRREKLRVYREKRDFSITPEPSDASTAPSGSSFVVQKHAARRLHYDFRLEHDGVLLSWAVPKGPSLNPTERRLAARTEDHPIEYGDFEGIIPAGEYGGGTVIVWDRGSWAPEGDATAALAKGRLTFTLQGTKLRGRWHLVRTGGARGRASRPGDKEQWLLFKGRDEAAVDSGAELVDREPLSVVTGRSIDEVAKDPGRVWHSNRPASEQTRTPPPPAPRARAEITSADARAIAELVGQLPTTAKLTNLEKVLYPEVGVTKGALVAYYATVAERMLPHVAKRPLSLYRCPNGWKSHGFFQKHPKGHEPASLHRVEVQEEPGGPMEENFYLDSLDGLIGLTQMGVLEIHTWGCHVDGLEKPDTLVFDFDPDEKLAWHAVVEAALGMRTLLGELGLESFVKTTGGKGLHVVVPVSRRLGWEPFKSFAKACADHLAQVAPDRYVTNALKKLRTGKIFVDYLRNGRGATAIAPYSTRARAGATVSVPLSWAELETSTAPFDLSVLTLPARLAAPDPWAGYFEVKQAITAAMRKRIGAAD